MDDHVGCVVVDRLQIDEGTQQGLLFEIPEQYQFRISADFRLSSFRDPPKKPLGTEFGRKTVENRVYWREGVAEPMQKYTDVVPGRVGLVETTNRQNRQTVRTTTLVDKAGRSCWVEDRLVCTRQDVAD